METERNGSRSRDDFSGRHLKLTDLKEKAECLKNGYLHNRVPDYPHPELHLSRLKHDTNKEGVQGIRTEEGFRGGKYSLSWWSLAVGPEEIESAETRLLEKNFPQRTEQQVAIQRSFLWKFASSPAFSETSRVGSYRFTFPLKEVLKAYSKQFCCGVTPVMRVFGTTLFKTKLEYTILVHSPAKQEHFSKYPLLKDDPNAVCVYRDCCSIFIWRPEAMCGSHRYELKISGFDQQMDTQQANTTFYVWDQVAIAFHVDNQQLLKFPAAGLRRNLTFCWQDAAVYSLWNEHNFDNLEDAKNLVDFLWPDLVLPLKEEESLQQQFSVSNMTLVLIGRKGVGKSSIADIILDSDDFVKSSSASSAPRVRMQRREVFDRVVTIFDTPGLSDELDNQTVTKINECIRMSHSMPHAILLVMRNDTIEAERLMDQLEEHFGDIIWRNTIILFTSTNSSIQTQLREDGPERQKVENRHHVIKISQRTRSRYSHRDQVLGLLTKVERMVAANEAHLCST